MHCQCNSTKLIAAIYNFFYAWAYHIHVKEFSKIKILKKQNKAKKKNIY